MSGSPYNLRRMVKLDVGAAARLLTGQLSGAMVVCSVPTTLASD